MSIPFKCPNCKKPLRVKDELAGKRAACPACKKPISIPAPKAKPADIEDYAAAALADPVAETPKEDTAKPIEFNCDFCGETVKLPADLAGKRHPCPACKNIVKVPQPKIDKPKDWRDINKKGPTAALMNLPEQLEGAWGTEIKAKVGTQALAEAGAVPDIVVEPLGLAGWIRRGLWVAAVVGVVALIGFSLMKQRGISKQKDAIAEARKVEESLKEDPKKRLHPVAAAAIDEAEGLLLLSQNKLEPARQKWKIARGKAEEGSREDALDHDLFLIELARTQFDLAGSKDEVMSKIRMEPPDMFTEVWQTLQKLKTFDAKIVAIRELGSDLIARKQFPMAIQIASKLSSAPQGDAVRGQLLAAQQTALMVGHGDPKQNPPPIKPPDKKAPLDLAQRVAYAEGYARKGQLEEAKTIAFDKNGPASHRVEAATGVACVLLMDKNNADAANQAAPFVEEALEGAAQKGVPPWVLFQLSRAAMRVPQHVEAGRQLAEKLPVQFKRRAQLDWVEIQLERGNAQACQESLKQLPESDGPTRPLAWLAVARRLGNDCPAVDPDAEDAACARAFANIGKALANRHNKGEK